MDDGGGRTAAVKPLLTLRGVGRSFGRRVALHPIDLRLRPGECVALTGMNGSGKSTLLRIACGRDQPSRGTVSFDGVPLDEADPAARARIAVVDGGLAWYPDLTVREHLQLVAAAHGVAGPDGWIAWALESRRLGGHADSFPGELSSGQLQALALAAALIRPRELLVLDEPEQHLDTAARRELVELLTGEKRDGVAVLLASHDPALVEAVADEVVELDDGAVTTRRPGRRPALPPGPDDAGAGP